MSFISYLHKAVNRENLISTEAQVVMELDLSGESTTAQIAAFLVALRMKGETADELVGFARAMRGKGAKVNTGMTWRAAAGHVRYRWRWPCTFNISTVAALWSRARRKGRQARQSIISSQCGSADILEALGVHIATPADKSRHRFARWVSVSCSLPRCIPR